MATHKLPFNGPQYPFNQNGFTSCIDTTAVINFGSIADAAQAVDQQTITGAALGDHVVVTAVIDNAGLRFWGYVSAADTVEVVASNLSGGAVDLASATFNIKVYGM